MHNAILESYSPPKGEIFPRGGGGTGSELNSVFSSKVRQYAFCRIPRSAYDLAKNKDECGCGTEEGEVDYLPGLHQAAGPKDSWGPY